MFLGSKNIDPSAGKLGMHSKTIVRNWPVQKFVRAAIVGLAAAVVMTPVASLAAKAEGALASPNSSLLMGGNPTRGTGYFANSHKQNRAICPCTWLNGHRCIRELVQFHTPSAENAGVFHRRYHQ